MAGAELHFGDDAWIDFVRNVAPPERANAIRKHLAGGCVECNRTFRFWSLLTEAAACESEYAPPEDLVASVKAAFMPAPRPEPWLGQARRLAKLVFDSWRDPLPAGVRGGNSPLRHLLYDAGDVLIVLLLETAPDARVQLAGQALGKNENPRAIPTGAQIEVVDRESRRVTGAAANIFGEFHLEFETQAGLEIHVHAGALSVIPLPDP